MKNHYLQVIPASSVITSSCDTHLSNHKVYLIMQKILTLILLLVLSASQAQITSTFATDADGWSFLNGITSFDPDYNPTGGNPDGHLSYTLSASNSAQYWVAPAKFRGSKVVKSLGMMLRFDLQQSQTGTTSNSNGDVRIIGPSGFIIVYSLPEKPAVAPAWTSYAIRLDETENWRVTALAGPVATRQDIIRALTNITSIQIRGTYATANPYTCGIDNVILEERVLTPPPDITSFIPASASIGDMVTINGTGFSDVIEENAVYLGNRKAEIVSASTTELVVKVLSATVADFITVTQTVSGLSGKSKTKFASTFDNGGRLIRGSFSPRINLAVAAQPVFTNAADLDGDGWADMVITLRGAEPNRLISIYRNLGAGGEITTGTFAEKIDILLPHFGAGGTSIADVDGDGKLDLIVHADLPVAQHSMAIYRNISTPGNLAFENPVYFLGTIDQSTSNPHVMDVDGDGRLDFVFTHGSSSASANFFILQNMSTPGNFEFARSRSFFGGSLLNAASRVASGDMDGDGKPEIAVITGFNGELKLIRNASEPGVILLEEPFTVTTSSGAVRGVQIIDLDGDGKNDIVWGRGSTDNVQIRQNIHDAGIFSATSLADVVNLRSSNNITNPGASSIQVADMNGDGKVDIIMTHGSDVSIFENLSTPGIINDASFGYGIQMEGSANINGPTLADFNGNGRLDILIGRSNATSISIFENNNISAPKISLNTVSPLRGPIGSLVTITGENFSDDPDNVMVHFGKIKAEIVSIADNEITARVPAGANYAPVSVTRDLLKSMYHLPFSVTFSEGVAIDENSFAAFINFTLTGADYDIDVGDVDNDGKPDIIAEGGSPGPVRIFRNTYTSGPINSSSLTLALSTASTGFNPFLFDVDQDGKLDLVTGNGIFKNTSTSTDISFAAIVNMASSGGNHSFADLDNDGKIDIINNNTNAANPNLNIFSNWTTNDGPLQTGPRPHLLSVSTQVELQKPAANGGTITADFDTDGFWEFASSNPTANNLRIWRNLGNKANVISNFAVVADLATGANPSRIYTADLDLDGKMDILVYHSVGTDAQIISVFHNTSMVGSISFNRIDFSIGANATTATIADLDGDGRPEIIIASEASGRIIILQNQSSSGTIDITSFAAPINYAVAGARGVFTGDINMDGKPEILVSRAGNLLSVLENLIPASTMFVITIDTQPANLLNACEGESASFSIEASGTTNITYQWQKYDVDIDAFVDLDDDANFNGPKSNLLQVTANNLNVAGEFRCVVSGDDADDVISNTGVLVINALPSPPAVSNNSRCDEGTLVLTATGANDGDYRWYESASAATVLVNNSNYTTPVISTTTSYFVSIADTFCESVRVPVTANISTLPPQPAITSSITPVAGAVTACSSSTLTLTAPTGFTTYNWSNGESTHQINVTASGVYFVTVTNAEGCSSPVSASLTVTIVPEPCSNQPPVIKATITAVIVEGTVVIDLTALISDPDDNLDIASLKVLSAVSTQGATAIINQSNQLVLNYGGVTFSGKDYISIEVCDLLGACTQQLLEIDVSGDIVVFNGFSPNGDDFNSFFHIQYIDLFTDTRDNKVTIFNRWGDVVFETSNYDNLNRVFTGISNAGKELPAGTYFYKIEFNSSRKTQTGFISLKR